MDMHDFPTKHSSFHTQLILNTSEKKYQFHANTCWDNMLAQIWNTFFPLSISEHFHSLLKYVVMAIHYSCVTYFNQQINIKVVVFWVATLCSLVGRYLYFGETYCFLLQGFKMEATCSFRTSLSAHETIQCYNPEDHEPQQSLAWKPQCLISISQKYSLLIKLRM
jgi:hypothetical protein